MKSSARLRIGLLVGNPFRDLPGQVLTAMRLCQDGCTSLLIPSYRRNLEVWTLVPDFVLLENIRRDKKGLLLRLASAGMRAGVLDTEGGVFPSINDYLKKTIPDAAALETLSGFYAWGPRVAHEMVAAGRVQSPRVTVTGTPRVDFYAEPWREPARRFHPMPEGIRQPFVLINGNFNVANPWLRDLDQTLREYVVDGEDSGTVQRWIGIQRQSMREFIALARGLATRLPEIQFVYRPHPFEKPEAYDGQLDGLPNLRLIKEGTIYSWVLRASAVVHRGSSTAIEARLAGVPALSPGWIASHLSLPAVESVSHLCASEDELVNGIRAASEGGLRSPASIETSLRGIVSDWFLAIDGRSHERLAAAILRGCGGRRQASRSQSLRILDGLYGSKVPFRWKARSYVRRALHLPFHWSFRRFREVPDLEWDSSQCFFGVDDVRKIVDAIEPEARELYGARWREVQVALASDHGEYDFQYRHGRSIVLNAV